jgi:hypothetical protein
MHVIVGEILRLVLPAVAALLTLILSARTRALLKSIFRRPSKPTVLVKVDDHTWVDTSDSHVLSEEELELLKRTSDAPATGSHNSRNGGSDANG